MVIMDNGIAAIGFSKFDGSIVYLRDRKRGIQYVNGAGTVPFRVELEEELDCSYSSFSYARDESYVNGQAYELAWEIEKGIVLRGLIRLDNDFGSGRVHFKAGELFRKGGICRGVSGNREYGFHIGERLSGPSLCHWLPGKESPKVF